MTMTPSDTRDILDRAQAQRAKTCAETNVWIRLDLLEGLIDEIITLRRQRRPGIVGSVADIVNKGKQEGKP